jgi:hypothetical protein
LISSKSFVSQQMHFISLIENIKIYMKIYIKTAPTCFDLRPSSVTLARLVCKLPDDGCRLKHVEALLI